ncbi:hypothetical protein LJB42_001717 [Komagataella kurtzmanii]|nr:hypothetical protein LJB42_001717 [Komagataella kurtzmanii]
MFKTYSSALPQSLSRGFVGSTRQTLTPFIQFVRGKRTKKYDLSPAAQKLITQLSVLSASRKQPKMLKLCPEDFVKHNTVQEAYKLITRKRKKAENEKLKQQYESMKLACEDLSKVSPELFEAANKREVSKRFSLELRVPTNYPPNVPWYYDYTPESPEDKK